MNMRNGDNMDFENRKIDFMSPYEREQYLEQLEQKERED